MDQRGRLEPFEWGSPFLVTKGLAHAEVHIEHNSPHGAACMNPVDPAPAQVRQTVEAACPVTAAPPTTQRMAGSCASRSASFTSSYPAKRPNTDWRNCPTRVWRPFAPVRVGQNVSSGLAQSKGIIKFAAGQQTAIRRDLRSVELQLETAVERQPKSGILRFTRRRFHSRHLYWQYWQNPGLLY